MHKLHEPYEKGSSKHSKINMQFDGADVEKFATLPVPRKKSVVWRASIEPAARAPLSDRGPNEFAETRDRRLTCDLRSLIES
jgi:hypothetical protein